MQAKHVYDPVKNVLAKQSARERDDARLRQKLVSRDELQRQNSFFGGLDLVHSSIRLRKSAP